MGVDDNIPDKAHEANASAYSRVRLLLGVILLLVLSIVSRELHVLLKQHADLLKFVNYWPLPVAAVAMWCIIFLGLLLPISPSAPLLVLSIALFGPVMTFCLAYSAGAGASAVKYLVGSCIRGTASQRSALQAVERARHCFPVNWKLTTIVFVLQAVPNPAYDLVAYFCGYVGLRFRDFYSATLLGGAVVLSIFCFFGVVVR